MSFHCENITWFGNYTSVQEIIIGSEVTSIGRALEGFSNLERVIVESETPISIANNVFSNPADMTLYVPIGCKDSYASAANWKAFKEIIEVAPEHVTVACSGLNTYCSAYSIDFTISEVKAYIASGFNPSTGELLLTRVYHVPAGEGLLLKGEAGEYEIPYAETNMYYSNLLKGVTTATTVSPTDGDYTNFILANGEKYGIGFYTLSKAGEIAAGKAYLQLPTSAVPVAEARGVKLVFDDETTGIESIGGPSADGRYFDLQGRRVKNPVKGLYIVGGRKMLVK